MARSRPFKLLVGRLRARLIGSLTLSPTVDAAGKTIVGAARAAHDLDRRRGGGPRAVVFSGSPRAGPANSAATSAEPFALFAVKTLIIAALVLFFVYMLASYKGLPNVLLVMGVLMALFVFLTKRPTFGRRIYAMGGNIKAAQLSGIKTERLTLLRLRNHGRARGAGGHDLRRPPQLGDARRPGRASSST